MSFTLLSGLAETPSSAKNIITHPGAGELPVGATQIGVVATANAAEYPLDAIYGDYQMRTIEPNLLSNPQLDMRLLIRTIDDDSLPITSRTDWGFYVAVSEHLEIDKVTPIGAGGGVIESQPGDVNIYYAANYSNYANMGTVRLPTGSTEIWNLSGRYYPFTLGYEVIDAPKRVTLHGTVRPDLVRHYWYFVVTLRAKAGTKFQIMHNGALTPATPNLWSGGQLTPVALNLPE